MQQQFEQGQRVRVIANLSGVHAAPIGSEFTFSHMQGMYARVLENQWNYNLGDLERIAESAEDLEKLVAKKKSELETLKNKLDYLEETGKEEVDFEEFKSYQVLKVLSDADLNLVQKSEKIGSLFKNKR